MSKGQKIILSSEVLNELKALEDLLHSELSQGNNFTSKEGLRLLKSGGKRLRPLFAILFSRLGKKYNAQQTLYTAAAIEVMHMATLIHDDTIDNATKRRGIDTTFAMHGIHTAVYTGDWMFIKSLQLISKTNDQTSISSDLLHTLSNSMESVFEGELDQYFGRGRFPSLSNYFLRIKGKTAALFSASCMSGAKIADLNDDMILAAKNFGENFGICFQILDDLLDIESTLEAEGKPVKNDLSEGIITLPVILACQKSPDYKRKIMHYLKNPDRDLLLDIKSDKDLQYGIDKAKTTCKKYKEKCLKELNSLPDAGAKDEIYKVIEHTLREI